MHLNIDCVRDVMLAVESNTFGNTLVLDDLCKQLTDYSQDEIEYVCLKLHEGNLLDLMTVNCRGVDHLCVARIQELTFNGHEFLETIRPEKTWDKTKSIAKSIGTFSLGMIKEIATNATLALIKQQF